ncbi:hypothetical protein [Curtobacterium sp. PhB115]|uniref:hypothetical protein n=1 Tax=Curtobacterium sp. PhB115 TaxID=2485173 RepID=UPI000F4BBC64|nr:hypothetical protein [Curtobacterium sp. PhB115]ROP74411.1 hypothetical protein EDF19_0495 [Curtobacterium sp. PhB115]
MYQEKKITLRADPKHGLIPVELTGFSSFDPMVVDLSVYERSELFEPLSFDEFEDHSELLEKIRTIMRERHGEPILGITGSGRGGGEI